jgi:hypothetical protein
MAPGIVDSWFRSILSRRADPIQSGIESLGLGANIARRTAAPAGHLSTDSEAGPLLVTLIEARAFSIDCVEHGSEGCFCHRVVVERDR